jgi:hypothetical protein
MYSDAKTVCGYLIEGFDDKDGPFFGGRRAIQAQARQLQIALFNLVARIMPDT